MSKVAVIHPTGMRVALIHLILNAIALTLHMIEKTLIEKKERVGFVYKGYKIA